MIEAFMKLEDSGLIMNKTKTQIISDVEGVVTGQKLKDITV